MATPVHLDRREPICAAPGASMYLDPTGTVAACCQNTTAPLGTIATSTLSDVWHGPAAAELRRRIAVGDLSLGCQEWEGPVAADHRDQAYLTTFDHLELVDQVGDGTVRAVISARREEHGAGTGVQPLAAFRRRGDSPPA